MKRRIRLRKKIYIHKAVKSHKVILTIVLLLVALFFSFRFINKKALPVFSTYAKMETSKLANIVINKAINKQLVENANIDNLYIVTKGNDGEIQTIDFNPTVVNQFLSTTVSRIQLYLKQIEMGKVDLVELPDDVLLSYDQEKLKKGIIYEIPSGIIFGNSFLANLGPKIPVKFSVMGNIEGNVQTKVTNYGINNALIEVNLQIHLTALSILPFVSDQVEVKSSVPLSIKIMEGRIPSYYVGGLNRETGTYSLPTS